MGAPKATVTFFFLILFIIITTSICTASNHATSPFPIPNVIKHNVDFWTKVYAEYSTSQGIVHDNRDLSIIYEVIDLVPYDQPGATKANRKRMKKANKKYEKILKRLAKNPKNKSNACRQVAKLFAEPHTSSQFSRAARRVRTQIGQKDRFMAGLIRSGAYLEQIRSILTSHGVPEDLAYLPHVESSFNPKAYSKFGAAGIWQFTRSTGKRFMSVGYTLDERRDPILATYAAAELLRENYEKLGCWALAITAYNHGAAGMQRAKNKYGDYDRVFQSYRSRTFKFASRNFYSEFIAARQVASNYKNFFGQLELKQPLKSKTVVLKGYASFNDLSRHFKVAPEILKDLNPALRNPVITGQKYIPRGYKLRLPETQLNGQPIVIAGIPDPIYQKVQKASRFYTVQRGDTAGRIAKIHRVKLTDLILANNLNHRATIYPKQTLRIPTPDDIKKLPKTAPAITKPPITVAKLDNEKSIEKPSDSEKPNTYTIKKDEPTKTYPQPMLASVIPLSPTEGNVVLFKPENTADILARNEEIVAVDIDFKQLEEQDGRSVGIIQVEVEETLGHYAEWAQVRTQQIRNINHLRFGNVLHLHQQIKIPLHHTDADTFKQHRYEFHKRLQEDFFAVYRIGELQLYKVRRGDNFWTICRDQFDIPMWLLKHCNPDADLADLHLNQKLNIPIIEKAMTDDSVPDTDEEVEVEGLVQALVQVGKF